MVILVFRIKVIRTIGLVINPTILANNNHILPKSFMSIILSNREISFVQNARQTQNLSSQRDLDI